MGANAIAHAAGAAAEFWLAAMGRTLVATAAAALFVFVLCRVWRKMPPRVRHWLWWLVCAKGLLTLILPFGFNLAVLPAAKQVVPAQYGPTAAAVSTPDRILPNSTLTTAAPAISQAGVSSGPAVLSQESSAPYLAEGLMALWLTGVIAGLVRMAIQARNTRRCIVQATEWPDWAADCARQMAEDLHLPRVPRLRQAPDISSPYVTGIFRPTLLAPADLMQTVSSDELKMIVAHEMSHLRAADLWLSWAPGAAALLLFPFPHIWFVVREYMAAREEACDADAIRYGNPSRYARMLVLVAGRSTAQTGAVAMSSGHRVLRRRLLTIANGTNHHPAAIRFGTAICLACAGGLVPFRLAARIADPPRPKADPFAATQFTITDIGPLAEDGDGAVSLNDRGDVGLVANGHAEIIRQAEREALGGLPHYKRDALIAVNNTGGVVAACYNYGMYPHGYVHSDSNAPLSGVPGFKYTSATAINDSGQIAGSVQNGRTDAQGAEVAHAVVWTGGEPVTLGALGGDYSRALGINNSGDVVGKADLPRAYFAASLHGYSRRTHAFVWSGGRMTDLQTLGGDNSLACAINDHGQSVGYSETPAGEVHACLWQNGLPVDLGALAGGARSEAVAINNQGIAVGDSDTDATGSTCATLWHAGRPIDLNTRLIDSRDWQLTQATAVNNGNQIAGIGVKNGRRHAYLLTPVTAPAIAHAMVAKS